jgi:L-cysteine desulfidase
MDDLKYLALLNKELVVAQGCTEPIAIAYAAALARKLAGSADIVAVNVSVSANIVKNAMAVSIPGTQRCGVDFAAALGALAGDSSKVLEVLSGITAKDVEAAAELVRSGIVNVNLAETTKKLYIEIEVHTLTAKAKAVIADNHTTVTLIEVNGETFKRDNEEANQHESEDDAKGISIDSIWNFTMAVDPRKLDIVKESIDLNKVVAQEGLTNDYGLQVGKAIKGYVESGIISDDMSTRAMSLAAAASDARMAGCQLPVMSNSGSGNQGITAVLPVIAAGEWLKATDEQILRAVTLSHLVTIFIKTQFGRLSAICGATVAAIGASCGITYLLGGGVEQIKLATQNMLGNVTGMLCDGAKAGCAMKISTCTSAAVQSALMAKKGIGIQSTDGIIEYDPHFSIENLCLLGNRGTVEADRIILEIMLNKKHA